MCSVEFISPSCTDGYKYISIFFGGICFTRRNTNRQHMTLMFMIELYIPSEHKDKKLLNICNICFPSVLLSEFSSFFFAKAD